MITAQNKTFHIASDNTSYIFRVTSTGHLENLYYGRKLRSSDNLKALYSKRTLPVANAVYYSESDSNLFLETICQEISTPGKGDCRESSIVVDYNNGMETLDFIYFEHKILPGKPRSFSGLPESYGDKNTCTTLIIKLKDTVLPFILTLYYTVFEKTDVIVRKTVFSNNTDQSVTIRNMASSQLDLPSAHWNLVSFDGTWARERNITKRPLEQGITILDSKTGVSSSRHNPCFFLEEKDGLDCYGFNLIYSGNHRELVEVSPFGHTRIMNGINPSTFSWVLPSGDRFQTPEAVMTFTHDGIDKATQQFHSFINNHIIRGKWKHRERPILINNWEATYFDFNENILEEIAENAASLGIELFVLDDGWFGTRNDDTTSLGDWTLNTTKLPSGLDTLSETIHQKGMMFGLWIEPEMISKKSILFNEHPDWAVIIPGREHSTGRNQFILDLTKREVREYLIKTISDLLLYANLDYVKWDMNRIFSDIFSTHSYNLREFNHRYMLGLYEILERITNSFPKVLFEGCAAGGNRFDLGILCYMPQIWTSDNTDVLSRTAIQKGTSTGYPLSTMGCHVSASPNHQTLRRSDLESRFNVAAFGILGYELDLNKLSIQQRKIITNQIVFYKKFRALFQYGLYFNIPCDENHIRWGVTNFDRSKILVLDFQIKTEANPSFDIIKVPFANPDFDYYFRPRAQKVSIRVFGDLINILSPVKINSEGKLSKMLADNYSIPCEEEGYIISGDTLAYAGVKLNSQFRGTGYNNQTRIIGDSGSRLYVIQRVEKENLEKK